MRLVRRLAITALVTFGTFGTARAQVEVSLTPYAGVAGWASTLGLSSGPVLGGRLSAMPLRWVGAEASYGFALTETDGSPISETDMTHWGLGVVFQALDVLPTERLIPYVLAGWSQLTYDGSVANPVGDTPYTFKGWEIGGGVRIPALTWERFRGDVRVDVRDVVTDVVQWFPDNEGSHHNMLFTVGLQLSLSQPRDGDGDGVEDTRDRCPRTPPGAIVDARGCPLDGDADGVPDGLDRCADTPRGAGVDGSGCPRDSDEDGVLDGLDRCPSTRPGVHVDALGCATDEDGDGVPDGIDACFNTPKGATVSSAGCPSDADGDGVWDGLDTCPDTPAGTAVDAAGCPVARSEAEAELLDTGLIRLTNIQFKPGSAYLNPASFAALDDMASLLLQWPMLEIEIGGHTDATGSDAVNRTMSQARAEAVLDYLVRRHPELGAERFTVRGYGEDKPIATNDTAEGRAENRRVEFRVVNPEALRHELLRRKSESR